MKDLTVSNIEPQNVLNNRFAIDKIQKHLGLTGMLFKGEYRFTKKMINEYSWRRRENNRALFNKIFR